MTMTSTMTTIFQDIANPKRTADINDGVAVGVVEQLVGVGSGPDAAPHDHEAGAAQLGQGVAVAHAGCQPVVRVQHPRRDVRCGGRGGCEGAGVVLGDPSNYPQAREHFGMNGSQLELR